MKNLFFLFFLVTFNECTIKVTDFCYKIEIEGIEQECYGNLSLNCGGILCSKDRYSCQSLTVFNGIKNLQKNENHYLFFKHKFELFMTNIKECAKQPKYEWNLNDVCFIDKNSCFKAHGYGIWSSLLTPNDCKCSGKYYNRCNSDYCALDKRACGEIKRNMDSIEKCQNYIY